MADPRYQDPRILTTPQVNEQIIRITDALRNLIARGEEAVDPKTIPPTQTLDLFVVNALSKTNPGLLTKQQKDLLTANTWKDLNSIRLTQEQENLPSFTQLQNDYAATYGDKAPGITRAGTLTRRGVERTQGVQPVEVRASKDEFLRRIQFALGREVSGEEQDALEDYFFTNFLIEPDMLPDRVKMAFPGKDVSPKLARKAGYYQLAGEPTDPYDPRGMLPGQPLWGEVQLSPRDSQIVNDVLGDLTRVAMRWPDAFTREMQLKQATDTAVQIGFINRRQEKAFMQDLDDNWDTFMTEVERESTLKETNFGRALERVFDIASYEPSEGAEQKAVDKYRRNVWLTTLGKTDINPLKQREAATIYDRVQGRIELEDERIDFYINKTRDAIKEITNIYPDALLETSALKKAKEQFNARLGLTIENYKLQAQREGLSPMATALGIKNILEVAIGSSSPDSTIASENYLLDEQYSQPLTLQDTLSNAAIIGDPEQRKKDWQAEVTTSASKSGATKIVDNYLGTTRAAQISLERKNEMIDYVMNISQGRGQSGFDNLPFQEQIAWGQQNWSNILNSSYGPLIEGFQSEKQAKEQADKILKSVETYEQAKTKIKNWLGSTKWTEERIAQAAESLQRFLPGVIQSNIANKIPLPSVNEWLNTYLGNQVEPLANEASALDIAGDSEKITAAAQQALGINEYTSKEMLTHLGPAQAALGKEITSELLRNKFEGTRGYRDIVSGESFMDPSVVADPSWTTAEREAFMPEVLPRITWATQEAMKNVSRDENFLKAVNVGITPGGQVAPLSGITETGMPYDVTDTYSAMFPAGVSPLAGAGGGEMPSITPAMWQEAYTTETGKSPTYPVGWNPTGMSWNEMVRDDPGRASMFGTPTDPKVYEGGVPFGVPGFGGTRKITPTRQTDLQRELLGLFDQYEDPRFTQYVTQQIPGMMGSLREATSPFVYPVEGELTKEMYTVKSPELGMEFTERGPGTTGGLGRYRAAAETKRTPAEFASERIVGLRSAYESLPSTIEIREEEEKAEQTVAERERRAVLGGGVSKVFRARV